MRSETTPKLGGSRAIGYGGDVLVDAVFTEPAAAFGRRVARRMTLLAVGTSFAVTVACGSGAALGDGTGDDGGAPPDAPPAATPPCAAGSGFEADFVTWELPLETVSVQQRTSPVTWRLLDLDGDARPDLVARTDDDTFSFRFWPNEGDGFAEEATTWTLSFSPETLAPAADDAWALVDLDGDGYVDVVDARDSASVGGPTWGIQRGGPNGPQPGLWTIPFPTGPHVGGSGVVQWQPMDLDGDGPLDMVAVSGDLADGVGSWSWWPGGTSGFATFERAWSIPLRLEGLRDPDLEPDWQVVDLDGDGPADLVVADPGGAARWFVYRGGETGFASLPVTVELPVPTRRVVDTRAVPQWRLIDVDGDGRLDFVTVGDGPGRWSVYFGVGTAADPLAFAETPVNWHLRFTTDRVEDVSALPQWRVIDLDGDGVLDLLRTSNAPDRWRVNLGRCVSPTDAP